MVIDMSEQKLVTLVQLRQFLDGTQEVEFRGCGNDQDRYQHIEAVVRRLDPRAHSARDVAKDRCHAQGRSARMVPHEQAERRQGRRNVG
ncbi:MAG TPA: hypothetical protein VF814_02965 [Casimicrobiaceae bacterium]